MPNETIEALFREISSLRDNVIGLANDMVWVKRSVVGLYAFIGLMIASVVGAYFAR